MLEPRNRSRHLALDTCDREALAWVASTEGFSGEIVRDVMLLAVERRFGGYHSDRRSPKRHSRTLAVKRGQHIRRIRGHFS